jgi:hypothetical protein
MADFVDIAPLSDVVTVRGNALTTRGLDIPAIGSLAHRFPELGSLLDGGTIELPAILALSENITSAICAAGCAQISEAGAANLALAEKAEVIASIAKMTMPRGFGPFVETLTGIMGMLPSSQPAARPAGKKAPASKQPSNS